jgi:hypothetical protein
MLTVAAAVVLSLWLVQLVLVFLVAARVPVLSSLDAPKRSEWPRLSMIVPARDEEADIEAALKSKLACGYPSLEVVAINDRSGDRTGDILTKAAEGEPRLKVAHVAELPEGWLGKLNAMQRGVEISTGEWVLFADADVHIEPGTLERLIAHAEAHGVDFFGVFPKMLPAGPIVDGVLANMLRVLTLTGRMWKVNDDRSHVGAGVGAFNLARRGWLEKTRALEALKMEILDDVGLGIWLKHHGARTRFIAGREAVHLLFMRSVASVLASASKAGHIFGWTLWRPVLFAVMPAAIDVLIPAAAIAFGTPLAQLLGVLAFVVAFLTQARLSWHFRAPVRGLFTWPLAHFANAVCTVIAGFRAWKHQGVYWRNTFYSRATLDAGQRLEMPSMRVRPMTNG